MKIRQDAWSHEDDLLLAETVLRHIREGSTQLNAFEEIGDQLNRTSAACGFRWNAEVRKKYYQAMELAKKQRKDRKRALAGQSQQHLNHNRQPLVNEVPVQAQVADPVEVTAVETAFDYTAYNNINTTNGLLTRQVEIQEEMANELNLDSVISYLYSVKNLGMNSLLLQSENERLTRENQHLLDEKEKIEKKLQRLKQENIIIQEDYQALVQIMDRARRMVSFIDPNNLDNHDLGQVAK